MLFVALSLLLRAESDPREIVRKCIELDQTNWVRMKDYTWTARETTRHLDSGGQLKSTDSEAWDTVILFGRPYHKTHRTARKTAVPRRSSARNRKRSTARPPSSQRETAQERQTHLADYEKEREKDRAVPARNSGRASISGWMAKKKIDGREAWVIHAAPRPGFQPKHGDAQAFKKIEGKIWIDKAEFQWVRIEAKTIDTISWGLCLARLNPGATLEVRTDARQ